MFAVEAVVWVSRHQVLAVARMGSLRRLIDAFTFEIDVLVGGPLPTRASTSYNLSQFVMAKGLDDDLPLTRVA